jgi:hypothetical protein
MDGYIKILLFSSFSILMMKKLFLMSNNIICEVTARGRERELNEEEH